MSACGCACVYTWHASVELYAQIFDDYNALDTLEGFCSKHGPVFYQLPINQETLILKKLPWKIPETYPYNAQKYIVPFKAGETLRWQIAHQPKDRP